MRVKVSRNLKSYCALTIWQIFRKATRQLLAFVLLALTATFAILMIEGEIVGGPVWLSGALIVAFSCCFIAALVCLHNKQPLNDAIKEYWRRNVDGYVAIFWRDTLGDMRLLKVVAWPALDSELNILRNEDGTYAIMPLFRAMKGWLFLSRTDGAGNRDTCRKLWGIRPVYLNADQHPGQSMVRVDDGPGGTGDSLTLPLYVIAKLLLAAPFYNSSGSSISQTIWDISSRCRDQVDDLAESERELADSQAALLRAIDALRAASSAITASKRFIKSKEAKRIREGIEQSLRELGCADESGDQQEVSRVAS
jgi:hypothetical protein